jgi:hypothetical protein
VKVLTKTDIESKQYSFHDTRHCSGFDVTYPTNATKEMYTRRLEPMGLTLRPLTSRRWPNCIFLRVSTRDCDCKGSFEYKIKTYDDHIVPLLLTDVDRLMGKTCIESTGRFLPFTFLPTVFQFVCNHVFSRIDETQKPMSPPRCCTTTTKRNKDSFVELCFSPSRATNFKTSLCHYRNMKTF